MLHKKNNEFKNSVQNYVNHYEDKNFRQVASKVFKGWPSPLAETWRLS